MPSVIERWTDYTETIVAGLQQMIVTDAAGATVPQAEAFDRWVSMTRAMHERGGQLFMIGNGGSAAMASHMATDALALADLRAFVFNDATLITAAANDLSFDETFVLPLERFSRTGDLLIAISQSGNSPNIVRGIEVARARGVDAITLSARNPDNRCRTLGTLNFYVPLARYGWAQSAHQIVLHYWFDQYMDRFGQGAV